MSASREPACLGCYMDEEECQLCGWLDQCLQGSVGHHDSIEDFKDDEEQREDHE